MKQYWQFDYYRDERKTRRFFYGTEAAVRRRVKKYECDRKELVTLSKSLAHSLKTEKKAHIIEL